MTWDRLVRICRAHFVCDGWERIGVHAVRLYWVDGSWDEYTSFADAAQAIRDMALGSGEPWDPDPDPETEGDEDE